MAAPKGHPRWGGRKKGVLGPKGRARRRGAERALKRLAITRERTMLEIGAVGFSRIGAVFNEHGHLKPVSTLPDHVQAAIASVKTLKTNVVSGDGQQEETREVKLWDKITALTLLAKHFGLVTDKQELEVHGRIELVTAVLNRIKDRNRAKSTDKP